MRGAWLTALCLSASVPSSACVPSPAEGSTPSGTRAPIDYQIGEMIFESGLTDDWRDWGWAQRKLDKGGPAELDLSKFGGWIVARPNLSGAFGALVFRYHAPAEYGDFLEVRVGSARKNLTPSVRIGAQERRDLPDGWSEVYLPIERLAPDGLPFDRILIRAYRAVGSARVLIDRLGLTKAEPRAPAQRTFSSRSVSLSIDCRGAARRIHPMIYGIASGSGEYRWEMGATARRWGGNPTSRYNWRLGLWNTASDWYFENVKPPRAHGKFFEENFAHGLAGVLTVPMIGWVAKDAISYSFPVAVFGRQRSIDSYRTGAGDGRAPDGEPIVPGSPDRTSVAAPPGFVKEWVEAIGESDRRTDTKSVEMYILDNEPMLWNSTHRDVHPDAVTYDELLERTIAYGTAVREADPSAVIAGPALWGWPAYFYSAKDAELGFRVHPDRLRHGNEPLLAWYLRKLAEHEKSTGVRILDVVDVHFYPQAKRVGGKQGGVDPATAALRIRSTRALWDPSYLDESWIGDRIQLIPRLTEWVRANYPGRGISIGEYNFGAEDHISGGLAVAEALGRFGQGGLYAAFYWTFPPEGSPAYWAFRAYRNFDGSGARFLDYSLPTAAEAGASLFASRDEKGERIVAVLLNLEPETVLRPTLELKGCGPVTSRRSYAYADGSAALAPVSADDPLPPYSITVVDVALASAIPGRIENATNGAEGAAIQKP